MKKSSGRWQVIVIIVIALLLAFATIAVLSELCSHSGAVIQHFIFGS